MESHHIDYLGYSPLHLYLKTDCTMCFVFNSGSIKPWWSLNMVVRPSPFISAWVTNLLTNTDLYIEFSTEYQYRPLGWQKFFVDESISPECQISHGMADPLLGSFRESRKACMTNSSHPAANLDVKETPDLPLV